MEIKLDMDNEVIILKLTGNLVASAADGLKEQMAKLMEKKYRYILLDLSKVDFIDSSGLGACIACKRDLLPLEGVLACAGLNEAVSKVFRMTRADQKIPVFATRQEGINALLALCQDARK